MPGSKKGLVYKQFSLKKKVPIDELKLIYYEWIHSPSGALIIHLENDDPENLFCLSFRTLPETSNGIAHILEHTVLCGSKKYPVKDPFFSMNRRSLNTFMNAMTGQDTTFYPASSLNKIDFYNLLSVYCDAVFHPKLDLLSFKQEGHRLEFDDSYDPSTPLKFKGIVFNEMKGAMASPDSRLYQALMEKLYPSVTYGVNSGGDPAVIPDLKYKELLSFHKKHYHPSKCLYFFYGDLPIEGHLDFLQKNCLSRTKKSPSSRTSLIQKKITTPKKSTLSYPIGDEVDPQNKELLGIGFVTCDILNQEDCLGLQILDILLMDTDASPLKNKILKSKLCKQTYSLIDPDTRQMPYLFFFKDSKKDSLEKLEKLILLSLKEIAKKGFSKKQIEGAFHQIEFERLEITGDSSPFGLTLFGRTATLKQHGGKGENGLIFKSLFDELHKVVITKSYFSNLIKKYFLKNTHKVSVQMKGDPLLQQKEEEKEQTILKKIKKDLSQVEIDNLIKEARKLKRLQEKDESKVIDTLPKLTVKDIPKKATDFQLEIDDSRSFTHYHHNCFTNHILYADLVFPLPKLSRAELPYVQLLANLLPELGSGKRSYKSNLEYMQLYTGHFDVKLGLCVPISGPQDFYPYLQIQGSSIHRNINHLFTLFKDTCLSPKFNDLSRVKTLLQQQLVFLENNIQQSPLQYALNLSSKSFSSFHTLNHLWNGIEYYNQVKKWLSTFDKDGERILKKLAKLSKKIFSNSKFDLITSADPELLDTLESNNFYGIEELSTGKNSSWSSPIDSKRGKLRQGKLIPTPVAFTSKAMKGPLYTDPLSPYLNLSCYLMDNTILHSRIREQGGAYGSGAIVNLHAGSIYFYSYRDPHLVRSLAAFNEAAQFVTQGSFTESQLFEAKLEFIQSIDKPIAPGSRAIKGYMWHKEGKSKGIRYKFRQKVLNAKKKDLIHLGKTYILPQLDHSFVASFADKTLFDRENKKLQQAGLQKFSLSTV